MVEPDSAELIWKTPRSVSRSGGAPKCRGTARAMLVVAVGAVNRFASAPSLILR